MIQKYAKSNPNFSVQGVTATMQSQKFREINTLVRFCDEVDFT